MTRKPEYAFLAIALVLTGLFWAALASQGIDPLRFSSYISNAQLYVASSFAIFTWYMLATLARERPARPIGRIVRMFDRHLLERVKFGAPFILGLIVFMPAFSAMKSAIPVFNPYSWDPTFIALDRAIHFADPWKLLQPVLGYPAITSGISVLYHVWILLIYIGSAYWAFCTNDRRLVLRYFLSYLAIWSVGGVFMATGLASVGPCFVGPILQMDYFDAQMAYLREADTQFPVMVLEVQDRLLAWYATGDYGLGRGITAMPSMHVALAFLFYLAMRQISRVAAVVFGIYCVVIMLGSVHLAYHYAVDGYVSIVVAALAWYGIGALLKEKPAEDDREPALSQT